jgi:hypothetical protein
LHNFTEIFLTELYVRQTSYFPPPQDGKVVEEGTHEELMEVEGLYHSLVTTQLSRAEEEELTTLPPEEQDHEDDVGLAAPEDKNNFESIKGLDLSFFGKMLHLLLLFFCTVPFSLC